MDTNKKTNELLQEYLRLQNAINITGDFSNKDIVTEQKIRKELKKRGLEINEYGRIENLGEIDIDN